MERMTIGVLAAASGVKITTIRYYERAGLMPVPTRTAGRHRNYTSPQLRRLLFICRARELEFSIEEIRILLVLADPAKPACGDIQHVIAAHLNKLRHKIGYSHEDRGGAFRRRQELLRKIYRTLSGTGVAKLV